DGAAGGDLDEVPDLVGVLFVVRQVALRHRHDLAVERVLEAPLDVDRHGLVGLVGHDAALHGLDDLHRFSPAFFSLAMVRRRAISRLAARVRRGFEACPTAAWIRRSNSSWRRLSTSARISPSDMFLISLGFIVDLPLDHLGLDGQLVGGQAEGLLGLLLGDVRDLEEHAARLHHADPVLHGALALTHAHFLRLLGDGLVGEDAHVDLATTAEVTAHRDAARLELVRLDPGRLQGHPAVVAEGDVVATLGLAGHATAHLLAVLAALRKQHRSTLLTRARTRVPRARTGTVAATSLRATATALLVVIGLRAREHRGLALPVADDLAVEHPHLDADDAVGGVGAVGAVVDVGAQGLQRHAAVGVPLGARLLGAAEAAGAADLDALGARLHGALHRLLHGAAEREAAFELLGDALRDERRVGVRVRHLLHVDRDGAVDLLGELGAQGLDGLAATPDHHARL